MEEHRNENVQSTKTESTGKNALVFLQINGLEMFVWTVIYGLLGAIIYIAVSMMPMPYTMVSLFKLGLLPSIAIIAVTGAIRGPLAGFLSGYLGVVLHDLIAYGVLVTSTLPAAAFGVTGLVVGLGSFQFNSGRSLAKLSVLSLVAFVITTLLVVVIGLIVEGYATMTAVGFVMLPMLTLGMPTAFLLTPVLAGAWYKSMSIIAPSAIFET